MHVIPASSASHFTAADVAAILRERAWLAPAPARETNANAPLEAWLERAAELLGPHAADRAALARLLSLVFTYDARALLADPENQAVLAREGAREVIRELASRVLDACSPGGGGALDSDRFKEIVEGMKSAVAYRSRAMFHPIRLALAGRVGEGELDRVILLLDAAAALDFAVPVKGARQRMVEFCAAFD